jgi:hypothetical protein
MATYLNKVLSLSLGDKRLKLRCCEGIDQTGLGDDEEEDLGASKDRQLVRLGRDISKGFVKQRQGLARQREVA